MRVIFLAAAFAALAQGQGMKIKMFSVGSDQTLTYPNGPTNPPYLVDLPDEHTTVIPPANAVAPYLVFGASTLSGGTAERSFCRPRT